MADGQRMIDEDEERDYKARSASSKFRQQLAYGVGAAMVFGLFSQLTGVLMKAPGLAAMTWGSATILPMLGIAAIGIIGIGCLYLSAKYLSENILADQAMQARQIGAATHTPGKAAEPVVEPVIYQPRGGQFPDNADKAATADTPDAPTKRWSEKIERSEKINPSVIAAVNDNQDQAWSDKVRAGADSARQAAL